MRSRKDLRSGGEVGGREVMQSFPLCTCFMRSADESPQMVEARLVQRGEDRSWEEIMETNVVLKNRQTQAYLGENKRWIESPSLALRFETPYHALYFCVSEELDDVDIMF